MSNSRNPNLPSRPIIKIVNGLVIKEDLKSGWFVIYFLGADEPIISFQTLNEAEEYAKANEDQKTVSYLDPKTSKAGKLAVNSPALHPTFHYPLIEVAELSIEKGYRPLNWLDKDNKVTASYLIGAAQRHLDAVKLGIDRNDKETKKVGGQDVPCEKSCYHAAQVAYNMLMLLQQMKDGVMIDDRLFSNGAIK